MKHIKRIEDLLIHIFLFDLYMFIFKCFGKKFYNYLLMELHRYGVKIMKYSRRYFSWMVFLILIASVFSASLVSPAGNDELEDNFNEDEISEEEYPFPEEYPSVEQLHDWYDDIVDENPDITEKIHLGESWEGRDIWAIKISDDVEEEQDEPSIFINGNLHSREWSSNQVSAYYVWRLVNDYGSNETITWLVNNRQIYVAPMVNPDGYIYDGDGDLDQAAEWRKNRNDSTPTDSVGVDLNRNWDIDWENADDDPTSDTYRGEAPFSEYETQHLKDFILSKDIDSYQDIHSHYGTLLIPWSYTDDASPHDDLYRDLAEDMTSMTSYLGDDDEQYSYGQAEEEIGYSASGGSIDWVYEETGAVSLCYELYTGGFWGPGFYPPEEDIMDINLDVYDSLVYQARIADLDMGDGDEDLYPPSPYIVYGTIEDEHGEEVEDFEVSVRHQETEETLMIDTDHNGYYEFNFANFDEHGYEDGDSFNIEAGDTTEEITVGDEWGTRNDLVVEPYETEVDSVVIDPEEDQEVEAGEELEFDVEALDEDGNVVEDDPEEFEWENADIGVFYETETGDYAVTATYDDVSSDPATVTVEPAEAEEIEISPQATEIIAGGSQVYTATAYDEWGNEFDVTGETSWSDDIDDSEWYDNELTAYSSGEWNVTGEYQNHSGDVLTYTASLMVEAEEVDSVIIYPEEDRTISVGEELEFDAEAYDEHGNLITDHVDDFDWQNADNGLFYETETGDYEVTATYDGITSPITTVTVESADIDEVIIEPGEDQIIETGEEFIFDASAYDEEGDLITDDRMDFEWENATRGVFNRRRIGEYEVTAIYNEVTSNATLVTVESGEAYRIEISSEDETTTAGSTVTYTATAYDEYENEIGDVSDDATWSIDEDAGGSWTGNEYTSEIAGDWTVTGEYDGLTDSMRLTVEPGTIDTVELTPSEDQTIVSGEKIEFSAVAYDAHGNLIADNVEAFAWENTRRGVFYYDTPGEYEVTATYDGVESEATTVTVEEEEKTENTSIETLDDLLEESVLDVRRAIGTEERKDPSDLF